MKNQLIFPPWVTEGVMDVFGLIIMMVGFSLLFNLGRVQAAGDTVPMVLRLNLLASFLHVNAAIGLFTCKKWIPVVFAIAVTLFLVAAIGFYFHVREGGACEQRTIGTLTYRIFVTALLYVAPAYHLRPLISLEEIKHIL